ncbi:hypothetical protein DAPPUDRAFT_322857 [Daphnia pulex]|uniref:Uncharacterized protein n=1 Tax=Daphnia pulex TaxID=6669 RepID=E9GX48_DAPPU|nr:hypothetical protein DAPPUDRAFT_322857 [Daphnia pulex]|eukprot:EFX75812.1 hypothetical protein DAPPUDRAFT_322857 [Daphnia pulex]
MNPSYGAFGTSQAAKLQFEVSDEIMKLKSSTRHSWTRMAMGLLFEWLPTIFLCRFAVSDDFRPTFFKSLKENDSYSLEAEENAKKEKKEESPSIWNNAWINLSHFFHPFVLLLCLCAFVRHTAGFSWAYNSQLYFDYYYPGTDVGLWLFLVSIVGGSSGILNGGAVSDRVVKRAGLQARARVLAASKAIASPFAAGVLLLPPPNCFASLLIAYPIAEMWFGVLFAILIECIRKHITHYSNRLETDNLPVIITQISKLMGYRETLILFHPITQGLAPQWISATAASSDILEGTDNNVEMNGASQNSVTGETLVDPQLLHTRKIGGGTQAATESTLDYGKELRILKVTLPRQQGNNYANPKIVKDAVSVLHMSILEKALLVGRRRYELQALPAPLYSATPLL